jgi:hypothetical protein
VIVEVDQHPTIHQQQLKKEREKTTTKRNIFYCPDASSADRDAIAACPAAVAASRERFLSASATVFNIRNVI